MAGHREGPRSRGGSSTIGELQEPYIKTAGNIMSAVQGFENGITGTPPFPTARGFNKEPGSDTFPTGDGAKDKTRPLGAFGLGGRD